MFFLRHSLLSCLRSYVRVLPWSSRIWPCATKSACFRGPLAKHLKLTSGDRLLWICLSRWQRAYLERVIGSTRRERLDHVIAFRESSLRKILSGCDCFPDARPHRCRRAPCRGKNTPAERGFPPGTLSRCCISPRVDPATTHGSTVDLIPSADCTIVGNRQLAPAFL